MSESIAPAKAALILEIGNSHLALAQWVEHRPRTIERLTLDELDRLPDLAESLWESLPEEAVRGVVAGSVVPTALERVVERVERALHEPVRVVGRDLPLPIPLSGVDSATVGVDRVCAAAAAHRRYDRACAVASFGTATTIDCVNAEGVFLGGAILAGLGMQAAALHERTAQLPLIRPQAGAVSFPRNTGEAINAGLIFGAVGALREVVERFATELGRWPYLVLTGGHASLLVEACDFVDAVEPHLCIEGIGWAFESAEADDEP